MKHTRPHDCDCVPSHSDTVAPDFSPFADADISLCNTTRRLHTRAHKQPSKLISYPKERHVMFSQGAKWIIPLRLMHHFPVVFVVWCKITTFSDIQPQKKPHPLPSLNSLFQLSESLEFNLTLSGVIFSQRSTSKSLREDLCSLRCTLFKWADSTLVVVGSTTR